MNTKILAQVPVLMARDVRTALDFYARLGYTLVFADDAEQPRYAGVARDGLQVHLQWQDASHWDNTLDRPAYRFIVDDVDALYAEFLAAGALPSLGTSPYREPAHTPWGTREFHLRDPDGNALQFCDQ